MNIRPLFSEEDEVLVVRFYHGPLAALHTVSRDFRDPQSLYQLVEQVGIETFVCDGATAPTQRHEADDGTWYTAYRFHDKEGNQYESRQGSMVPSIHGAYEPINTADLAHWPLPAASTTRVVTAEYAVYALLKRLKEGGGIERIGETIRLIKLLTRELWNEKQLKVLLRRPHDPILLSNVILAPPDSAAYRCLENYRLDAMT